MACFKFDPEATPQAHPVSERAGTPHHLRRIHGGAAVYVDREVEGFGSNSSVGVGGMII